MWTFGAGIPGLSVKNTAAGNAPGIFAESKGSGPNGAALFAYNTGPGIAIWAEASTNETVLGLLNGGSGNLIRAYNTANDEVFAVHSSGQVKVGAQGTFAVDAIGLIGGYFSGVTGLQAFGGYGIDGSLSRQAGRGIVASGVGSGFLGAGVHGINNTGVADAYAGYFKGNLAYTCTILDVSDIRLKRDVLPLLYGLNEIQALKPVTFTMNDDPGRGLNLGLIAQDVRPVLPELVIEDSESGMLSLRYVELIPVLIKAIQEQQTQIEALRDGSEPRPSEALHTPPVAEAPVPAAPSAIIRQSVGPSNAALWGIAGAIVLFALAVVAHGRMSQSHARQ